jgi:hypothetical protein
MTCMIDVKINEIEFDLLYDVGKSGVVVPLSFDITNKRNRNALQKAQQICYALAWICNYHQSYEIQYGNVSDETLIAEVEKVRYWMREYKPYLPVRTVNYLNREIKEIEDRIEARKKRAEEEFATRNHGYVYLIASEYGYKIGKSKTPDSRKKAIKVAMPFTTNRICLIKTTDMHQLEIDLHEQFATKRLNGEWFNLTPDDVAYIQSLSEGGGS